MNLLVKISASALLVSFALAALTGSCVGFLVIWVNLSQKHQMEALITKRLEENDVCLSRSASFTALSDSIPVDLMKKIPKYASESTQWSEFYMLVPRIRRPI